MVGGVEVKKSCIQINFLVEVKESDVKINPDEHSVVVSANEQEVEHLKMTQGMRVLVGRAFNQFVKRKL